jgi:hypothetical protein
LEFAVVGPEEGVQRAVLHVLGYDHDRIRFGHHPLQEYHVRVFELAHDRGFGQEIVASLVQRARLQGLDGHVDVDAVGFQFALADVPELAAA